MNLTITDDMIIKFVTGGTEYTIDKMVLNENGTEYEVYNNEPAPSHDYSQDYFTIESLENNNTISVNNNGTLISNISTLMQYSRDKETWTNGTGSGTVLNAGEKMYFRMNLTGVSSLSPGDSRYLCFLGSKKYNAMGNITSLYYGSGFTGQTTLPTTPISQGWFRGLFMKNASHGQWNLNLISARNLVLHENGAGLIRMFWYCGNLLYAPKYIKYDGQINGQNCTWGFCDTCPKLEETPLIYASGYTGSEMYGMFMVENTGQGNAKLKRLLLPYMNGSSGYGVNIWSLDSNGGYYYKTSSATDTWKPSNFTYRTLSFDPEDYIHIWAEPETPYAGSIGGCSDYFESGDSVTLQFYPCEGYTFSGWYDGDTLLSSSNPYTFTASANKTLKVRTTTS